MGARAYLLSLAGWWGLLAKEDVTAAKQTLEKAKQLIEGLAGIDAQVHASIYRLAAQIDHHLTDCGSFYNHALLFLQLVLSEDSPWKEVILPQNERAKWLEWICIAALLAENVYSFGGLVQSLPSAGGLWIQDLVGIFHRGDIGAWERFLETKEAKTPLIANNLPFLGQKICIMALVEGIWAAPRRMLPSEETSERHGIPFSHIAAMTRLSEHEVEFLVMKAMALGLIRGSMDQVAQTVHVSWVRPRILDLGQVRRMHEQVGAWQKRVQDLNREMLNQTDDWLASSV
jgi:26S proteasome regulatory subunit N9